MLTLFSFTQKILQGPWLHPGNQHSAFDLNWVEETMYGPFMDHPHTTWKIFSPYSVAIGRNVFFPLRHSIAMCKQSDHSISAEQQDWFLTAEVTSKADIYVWRTKHLIFGWLSRLMVCEGDPRVSTFILTRRVLEKETIKIRGKGLGHRGIPKDTKRRVLQKYIPAESESSPAQGVVPVIKPSTLQSSSESFQEPPKKRLRKSADRDISQSVTSDFARPRASRHRQF